MKNLLFTIVLSLGSGLLFAHHNSNEVANNSDLNIKMWDNSSFTIKLDHEIAERTRSFNLTNVRPGRHYVEIIKKKRNRHGNGFFVKTIYKGRINVPSKRKVFVRVEGKNQLSFKFFKKRNRNNGHDGYGHGNNHGNHYGSNNYNGNWNSDCSSSNSGGGYYGESDFGNSSYGNHNGPNLMNQNSFNQLVRILGQEHFDDDRLGIAKQAIASNNMSVNQVSMILDKFTFDRVKLEFAKVAYRKTVDRENYFMVNSRFTFSSRISELNNYIANT
jgi:hypothetical protein